ncbi:hypothetical protein [Herbaspirillum huttiense]|uniref:hypothetical protein n=1 Tax=Herbaspirillum huttiense TaxID=863372 RepID=UPI0039AEF348
MDTFKLAKAKKQPKIMAWPAKGDIPADTLNVTAVRLAASAPAPAKQIEATRSNILKPVPKSTDLESYCHRDQSSCDPNEDPAATI